MASSRIPVLQFPSQLSLKIRNRNPHTPKTFEQALADGWVLVSEVSRLSPTEKVRLGKAILKRRSHRVSVSYTATSAGFMFGVPQLVH